MTIEPPAFGEPAARSGRAIPATRGWSRRRGAVLGRVRSRRTARPRRATVACCCSTACRGATSAIPGLCPAARGTRASPRATARCGRAAEEAGVPARRDPAAPAERAGSRLLDYTTLVGDVVRPFEPTISDPESRELAWVPAAEVADQPLHPGFATSWAVLQPLLGHPARDRGGCRERHGFRARRLVARSRRRPPERLIARIGGARGGRASRQPRSTCPSTRGSPSGSRSSKARRVRAGDGRRGRRGRQGRGIRRRRDRRARPSACRGRPHGDGGHERPRARATGDGCRCRRARHALAARPAA